MEPKEIFHHWFILHKTVDFLKEDLEKGKEAPLKLPSTLSESIRLIGRVAYGLERESAKTMRATGIRLVKEFFDQNEYFVIWSHRGEVEMLRLHENIVKIQTRKKVEEITKQILESKASPPSV